MKRSRLVFVVAAVLAGCGELPEPQQPELGYDDPAGEEQPSSQAQQPADDVSAQPPATPTLDPAPAEYGYETLPVRGRVGAFETVFVEGGRAPVASDADAEGRFCVDVPLVRDRRQALLVYAQNEQGVTSSPSRIDIEQDSSLAEVVVPTRPLADRAVGASFYSDTIPKAGLFEALTDGDVSTSVLMPASVIWVELDAEYDLEQIDLVFPAELGNGDDTFAVEYAVLASNDETPALPPSASSPTWTLLAEVTDESTENGDGGIDRFTLPTPLRARYVAFVLQENNKIDWLSSEDIRVSEVRVLGRSSEEIVAEPHTPSCADAAQ